MLNGVMNVYKEAGYTSHDVVAKLRGIIKQKKIGHMGTLDPNAVGVLPVCLGKATKLCEILSDKDKTYRATLLLGVTTNTQDITGEIVSRTGEETVQNLDERKVIETVKSFIGDYEQIPPMFSAIKIGGRKLYQLARRGEVIERPARHCIIHKITVVQLELPRVELLVTCSKGTYIRTLCQDIGDRLGVGGTMESLTRTRVDSFRLEDSITLSQIKEFWNAHTLEEHIIPTDQMLNHYSKCIVSEKAEKLVYNGNIFTSGNTLLKMKHRDGQIVRIYTQSGEFVGLYKFEATKQIYRPDKIFL